MWTNAKQSGYRLLDMRLPSETTVRLLIYHSMWETIMQVLCACLSCDDLTGESLDTEALDQVDALVCWKCPDHILDRLVNLKWIQTTSAGIDQLASYLRTRPGVLVTTAKGIAPAPIASYVLLMILAFRWDLPGILQRQRDHQWKLVPVKVISEATCAVVGLGNVGRAVAEQAKQFGMTVVGTRRHPEPVDHVDRLFPPEHLHEMLSLADFVVLTLPLTENTRGMFSTAEFAAMKRRAYLIQVSRGGIVDELALGNALRNRTIAGAAIDVFEQEPLPRDDPLWDAPNCIITAHQAAERDDYIEAAARVFLENLMAYPRRERMRGVADVDRGY